MNADKAFKVQGEFCFLHHQRGHDLFQIPQPAREGFEEAVMTAVRVDDELGGGTEFEVVEICDGDDGIVLGGDDGGGYVDWGEGIAEQGVLTEVVAHDRVLAVVLEHPFGHCHEGVELKAFVKIIEMRVEVLLFEQGARPALAEVFLQHWVLIDGKRGLFGVEQWADAKDVLEVGNGLCRAFACDPQGEIAAHGKAEEEERQLGFAPCHGLDGGEDFIQ